MMVTLSRLYSDNRTACLVVEDLQAAGLPEDDIGIISRSHVDPMENADTENSGDMIDRDRDGTDDRTEAAEEGAAIGGAAGAVAGLGAMMVPGVGAVIAVGWVGAVLAGALAGGATGGVIGALLKAGVSENSAGDFAQGIRQGGTLVTVRVMAEDRQRYENILDAGGQLRDRSGDPTGLTMAQ
jgi:hypothetical protein